MSKQKQSKKRPPLQQLLQAGEEARLLLEKKGLLKSAKDSVIDHIFLEEKDTVLPGIPAYLPKPPLIWRFIDFIIYTSIKWDETYPGNNPIKANFAEFINFAAKESKTLIDRNEKAMKVTVKTKTYNTRFLQQQEILEGVDKLMWDSFALSLAFKNDDAIIYMEWVNEWLNKLLLKWPEPYRYFGNDKRLYEYYKKLDNGNKPTTEEKDKESPVLEKNS